MNGILYGVGIGPGDPELISMRAVRAIREADVIAVPQTNGGRTVALDIAREYIQPEAPILQLDMPMTHDKARLDAAHNAAAAAIAAHLEQGRDVVFLTLGDVSLYSTFAYVQRLVENMGHEIQLIPGIPAICAVAAKLKTPLAEGKQPLLIVPAIAHDGLEAVERALAAGQNVAVMKAGSKVGALREMLEGLGNSNAAMVENCGMPEERIVRELGEIGESSGYFSTLLIRPEGN